MTGDPETLANNARAETLQEIAEIHDEHDTPAEIVVGEQEAIDEYAETVADALLDGLGKSKVPVYAGPIADAANYYNKSNVKQAIQDALEAKSGKDRKPFDEIITGELRRLEVYRSTDHKQGALYRWFFPDCQLETGGGENGRQHYDWSNFRKLYLETAGKVPGKPNEALRDYGEWGEFIGELIEERAEETVFRGPRTEAVDRLKNKVLNATGTTSKRDMIERQDVRLALADPSDGADWWLPHWWDYCEDPDASDRDVPAEHVEEIHVPNRTIANVIEAADNDDMTKQALYSELKSRNFNLPRLDGSVSEKTYLRGQRYSYWALSPELELPRAYAPPADDGVPWERRQDEAPTPDAQGGEVAAATDGGEPAGQDSDDGDDGGSVGGGL